MKIVAESFKVLEENAAKVTVSESTVVSKGNKIVPDMEITDLDGARFVRSYELAKIVNAERLPNLGIAFAEGAATGAPGFAGIPFNIVLSNFIYYRAVQSTAMFYGYDVKNDPKELVLAREVFTMAMSPHQSNLSEMGTLVSKMMLISEFAVVGQVVKKGWKAMAEHGGVCLLIA